jgi:flagellar hook assembly protein FlgD
MSRRAEDDSVGCRLVRDGYRDSTTFNWTQTLPATNMIKVRRLATGRVVTSVSGPNGVGSHGWTWAGRNYRGKLVPVGKYAIELAVRTSGRRVTAVTDRLALHR